MPTYMGQFQIDTGDVQPVASTLYGTCDTNAITRAKVVTCANFDKQITGVAINVKFTHANAAITPTLNVNNTGAKPLILGSSYTPSMAYEAWPDGAIITVVYDGTSWCVAGDISSWNQQEPIYASGYCDTDSNTMNKVVQFTDFTWLDGSIFQVVFANGNTSANPLTMTVNGEAAPLWLDGETTSAEHYAFDPGVYWVACVNDGIEEYYNMYTYLPDAVQPMGVDYAAYADSAGHADQSTRGQSIFVGELDSTSTATVMTATIDGIGALYEGTCICLSNNVVDSAANCTLNINNQGAKPMYITTAASTRVTTSFKNGYTMLFIYNTSRVSGGCWDMYRGSDVQDYDVQGTFTLPSQS